MLRKFSNRLSQIQLIAFGFFAIILTGTLLLMTPLASRAGTVTPFLTSLFTATSATCVTGLTLVDTFTHWSLFGQLVLIILIQIGGLGFITIGFATSLIFRKKIGLRQRGILKESINVLNVGGIVRMALLILKGTALIEGTGAVILSLCFIPDFGVKTGIYYGIFHSISAFCNAGFDLMGCLEPSTSMILFNHRPVVLLTLAALISVGAIGFFVWNDVKEHKLHIRKYALHTKIVLLTTLILIVGGTLGFYLLERNHLFQDMTPLQQFTNALFCAVTPRTAGFNSVSNADLIEGSKFLTILLMFIGGAPGSTAGGIKVTTIVVLILYLRTTLLRSSGINIFRRRLEDDAVSKAAAVFCMNLFSAVSVAFLICSIQHFDLTDVLFEVISAISTVGMSAGITGQLHPLPQILIIFLMYIGRVGSLSFAMSFTDKKRLTHILLPKEHISIG